MMNSIRKILAAGLGTGYLPLAPGTWGSLAVVAIYAAVAHVSRGSPYWSAGAMAGVLVAASAACVALGPFAERQWNRKDPPRCTLDEWAGQALALIALPLGTGKFEWVIAAAAAFVTFRVFDIVKPPPAGYLERLRGGWGILADDLVAGLYANAVSQVAVRYAMGMIF